MSKHTPGPWKADKNSGCRTIWGRKIGKHAQAQYVTPICSTPGLIDDGEDEANARLIAAAPDLLEALRFYANRETYFITGTDGMTALQRDAKIDGYGSLARQAIEKAQGK